MGAKCCYGFLIFYFRVGVVGFMEYFLVLSGAEGCFDPTIYIVFYRSEPRTCGLSNKLVEKCFKDEHARNENDWWKLAQNKPPDLPFDASSIQRERSTKISDEKSL